MKKKDKSRKSVLGEEGIYDARVLGKPKMLVLGFQHTLCDVRRDRARSAAHRP